MTARRAALVGGIGAGKSHAATLFGRRGAIVLHADDVARSVLDPGTAGHAAVAAAWPTVVVDGEIDRRGLGRIVFADPEALRRLEAITHPETRSRLLRMTAEHPDDVVVVEIPILRDWFEGWTTILVDAPDHLRLQRAVARDVARDESAVRAVMARQPTRSEWLLAADLVIDNSGDLAHLDVEVGRVWDRLVST